MITIPPTPQQLESVRKRNKLIRWFGAVLAGIVIGQLCPQLPLNWQGLCHLAAKAVAFICGGSP